jgi:hypothetical protein
LAEEVAADDFGDADGLGVAVGLLLALEVDGRTDAAGVVIFS